MEKIIKSIAVLQQSLPVNFNATSSRRLVRSVAELLHLMSAAEEEYPAVATLSHQLVPSLVQHIEISAGSKTWKAARFHFVEAIRQLANIINHLLKILPPAQELPAG